MVFLRLTKQQVGSRGDAYARCFAQYRRILADQVLLNMGLRASATAAVKRKRSLRQTAFNRIAFKLERSSSPHRGHKGIRNGGNHKYFFLANA